MSERLERIGPLAAELCYAKPCSCQDNICVGSCRAVVSGAEFLKEAARQIFDDYWRGK